MAGKRKRGDTGGASVEREVNGDSSTQQQEHFHNWLEDALVILRE